ncbi:MAG TPA: NADH pyrophosphatase, partial [Alphaproteobacteria bacterium]|nr:NADH pyrophosphatase [Alphaproteobacteria bacterium]
RWFSRKDLRDALEGNGDGSFFVPPPFAIAHQLVRVFVEQD